MTGAPFRFETLGRHDRAGFLCGQDALDGYFQTQVTQDVRRRVAKCFVLVECATGRVAAYYTLSAASIPLIDLPAAEAKRLPRYPTLPAVRIGRSAVDGRFQRRGLGELMLIDAVVRSAQAPAAAYAIIVDAKDDAAATFHKRYGFRSVAEKPLVLFLPLETAEKSLLPPEGA